MKFLTFLKKEKTVLLMLVYIAFCFYFFSAHPLPKQAAPAEQKINPSAFNEEQDAKIREKIAQTPWIGGVVFLLIVGGIAANVWAFNRKRRRESLWGEEPEKIPATWGFREIFFIFVLLYFVEAVLFSIEYPFLMRQAPGSALKDYLTLLNSLLRDLAVAGYVIHLVTRKLKLPARAIGLQNQNLLKNITRGAAAYVIVIPWLLAILTFLNWLADKLAYQAPAQPVVEMFFDPNMEKYLVYFTFFVAILGPLIEEVFFRGFVYGALRVKWGGQRAMWASAFLFSLLHMHLMSFVPIFFLGFYLAYLYEKTGSLVPCMTVHMIHNLIMVWITFGVKAAIA